MSKTTTITIRVDPKVKKEAETTLHKLGLTTSQAVSLFLRQVSLARGLPFAVLLPDNENSEDETPNAETLAAIDDLIHRRNVKVFNSVDDAFKELEI